MATFTMIPNVAIRALRMTIGRGLDRSSLELTRPLTVAQGISPAEVRALAGLKACATVNPSELRL